MTAEGDPSGDTATSIGVVASLGVHILDVLGRPVGELPAGQGGLLLDEIRITAAGTAAGTSVDLAKLGAQVRAFGAIGNDASGRMVSALLEDHGVDCTHLAVKYGVPTSATILPIRPNGDRPALHAPGASARLEPSDIDVAAICEADVLHVGGPDALGAFGGRPLAEIVSSAKKSGLIVTLDLLGAVGGSTLDQLTPLLEYVDWLMPNDDQLKRLTGEDDICTAASRVLDLGVGRVAVSLGGEGCLYASKRRAVRLAALPVSVVDTTGCGDGFSAGVIAGSLLGCDPLASCALGNACGALVASGLGSDAGIVDLESTVAFLGKAMPELAQAISARMSDLAKRPSTGSREKPPALTDDSRAVARSSI